MKHEYKKQKKSCMAQKQSRYYWTCPNRSTSVSRVRAIFRVKTLVHREIYLSDPRKVTGDRLKTLLRYRVEENK
ncbi:hypothetical protein MKY27_02120 [Solibacillus sp. FSL R5-0449]|uniref:hypothetical protein n=1 Tax=Solibacillus sp. FSL R5-0449 TaxID=2921639 RepID=UPI0030CFC505